MHTKLSQIVYLPIDKIIRDENQPRQYFDPIKLGRLSDSIKKMGIKEPLTVEALPNGTYMIVDGERRWRSAHALGLKEVPAIVEHSLSVPDRIVEQFHLQEMREGWQPDEKAMAIKGLSELLDITYAEAAKMVGIAPRLADGYHSLTMLMNREVFISHKLPIERATNIISVLRTAKFQAQHQLGTEISDDTLRALEDTLMQKLVSGEMKTAGDIRTLRDSIIKDVKNVEKFIKGKTANQLFIASDAGGVRSYRLLKSSMNNIQTHLNNVIASKDARILLAEDRVLISRIKNNIKKLESLI